jgi:hypothetical protein
MRKPGNKRKALDRAACLDMAKDRVTRNRADRHGDFMSTYTGVAELWRAYLKAATGQDVALGAHDCAQMLVLMKIGRAAKNPGHVDSYVDQAGYSALACETRSDGIPLERTVPF